MQENVALTLFILTFKLWNGTWDLTLTPDGCTDSTPSASTSCTRNRVFIMSFGKKH